VARRAASILNWFGLQDASRKRRNSSQSPDAWSGSVIQVIDGGVSVLSDADKWNKAKELLKEVALMLGANPEVMCRKRLEQIRGFLTYVTRTYPCMIPYLIGFHMTIDFLRANRGKDGWRLLSEDLRIRARTAADLG
jgi:hypothetical protein